MDQANTRRSGGISVETAHIFPIIKKWLYSEKDIFLRELVSNAADAVTKHKRLVSLGQIESGEDENYRITVTLDKSAGTLTVSDNGIGMTEEEVSRYLGNIALSGALDFVSKYEGEKETSLKAAMGERPGRRIALFIGPEGGFEPEEVQSLVEKGARPVSLGPRILRTETAGMAMVAQILFELGE